MCSLLKSDKTEKGEIVMGKCFSDKVEQALDYIYYHVRQGKGAEGFAMLEQASAEGDGDASCILARCLCGNQYVWGGHDFSEDDKRATALLRKSVEQGSAIGVLVALRSGELTPSMERKMPFENLQEAFDVVLKKAEDGDSFCQYTVANSYFWWDFLRIQGKGKDSFPTEQEYKDYLRENILKCEEWFHKALQGGMHLAANNLNKLYTKGDADIVAPRPELAADLYRIGAERGIPVHQWIWGDRLTEQGKKEEALGWYKLAAEGGQYECWYLVGEAYYDGKIVPCDYAYAAQCFENGMKQKKCSVKKIGCANFLGELYYGGKGVPQDYAKSFQYFQYALDNQSNYGVCYVGKMYFRGNGTQRNYIKAREMLEKVTWTNREAFYMLGVIYGQGLGVEPNIEKAVSYLQKAGDWHEAKAEMLKYKKTLFGKWVRR